jgi:hypothetical protein
MTTIITEDKDYIIEISKKSSIFNPERFMCNFTFKTPLNNIIVSINISDMDLLSFMDNYYFYYESGENIIYSFPLENTNMIIYSFGLSNESHQLPNMNYCSEDIFSVYSYSNGNMNKIISFKVTYSSEEILNTLYEEFLEDLPKENRIKYLYHHALCL